MITESFLEWATSANVARRTEAADALAQAYLHIELEDDEFEGTEATLTLLLDDPSRDVRAVLAEVFCDSPDAPRHIITALATDIPEIATLVLTRSPIFHDAELVDIIVRGDKIQQAAIAQRPVIDSSVVAAIAEHAEAEACLALLMNPSACLKRSMVRRIAERHGNNGKIRTCLLERTDLPGEIRQILTDKLGEALGEFVTGRKWLSKKRSDAVIAESCDKASIQLAARSSELEIDAMVADLIEGGKMTPAYLLRTICMGNIELFVRSLAHLSEMPFNRVEHILSRRRRGAFKAVYDKAGLPTRAFPVFSTAVATWQDMLDQAATMGETEADLSRLPYRVVKEILNEFDHSGDPEMNDLLVLLRRFFAEAQRDKAIARAREAAKAKQLREIEIIGLELEEAIEEAMVLEFGPSLEEGAESILEQSLFVDSVVDEVGKDLEQVIAEIDNCWNESEIEFGENVDKNAAKQDINNDVPARQSLASIAINAVRLNGSKRDEDGEGIRQAA